MKKKVLITGNNGFIGTYCTNILKNSFEIFGLDVYGEEKENFILGELNLNNLLKFNQKFDIIVHLAGTGSVGVAQRNPEIEHAKTVLSSKHLLDYIVKYNQNAKLIYISSAAVYGNSKCEFVKENSKLNPISIYGQHKVAVENLIVQYSNNFGLKYNIIRPFSVYGEGLKKQVLWDFCNKIKNNFNKKSLICFGTGEEERDFIHVKDLVLFINHLINSKENNDIINVGTGIATSIGTIFEKLVKLMNYSGYLDYDNIENENNPKILVANIHKMNSLGFKTSINIDEGLTNYVEWFKKQN